MILQALTRYYETLLEEERIAPPYYAKANISFGIYLRENGEIMQLLPLREEVIRGNKKSDRPKPLDAPVGEVKAVGIVSNFLWDSANYLLGLDTKGNAKRTMECFDAAKELHLRILDGLSCKTARAIRAYFSTWNQENAAEHPAIMQYIPDLMAGCNLVFCGLDSPYAFEESEIRKSWERYCKETESTFRSQCLVTGLPDQPIENVHPKIKGVKGGQAVGTSLVSFNGFAYESYGQTQSYNAPVSEYAAFAYTSALNSLIADFDHRMSLDGDTVVCWAETGEEQYQNAFNDLTNPRAKTEKDVSETLRCIVNGQMADLPNFHPETPFYVLCLSPNAARVSVRFFLRDTFGTIAENLVAHYKRLEIDMAPGEWPYLSLYWMLKETVPPGSNDDAASPLLAGATMRAILSGAPYPTMLFSSILIRIRADRKVNRARAATIKAYLIHNIVPKHPNYEEVLQVALNEQSELKPYVLGRLFSLLEQAQESALGLKNATITDRYFDSASATPKLAFPTLLKLNRHHLAKDESWGWKYERQIGELLTKLEAENDPYPARLTLEEQGLFILGYYHQKQARYAKKAESEKENQTNEQC